MLSLVEDSKDVLEQVMDDIRSVNNRLASSSITEDQALKELKDLYNNLRFTKTLSNDDLTNAKTKISDSDLRNWALSGAMIRDTMNSIRPESGRPENLSF